MSRVSIFALREPCTSGPLAVAVARLFIVIVAVGWRVALEDSAEFRLDEFSWLGLVWLSLGCSSLAGLGNCDAFVKDSRRNF